MSNLCFVKYADIGSVVIRDSGKPLVKIENRYLVLSRRLLETQERNDQVASHPLISRTGTISMFT